MSAAFDIADVTPEDSSNPFMEFMTPDIGDPDFITEPTEQLDTTLAEETPQTPRSKRYQKKANVPFRLAFKRLMQSQDTVIDAATVFLYAPKLTRAIGDLADADPRVAKGLDMLSDTVENPYAAVFAALVPFALQTLRNHEPDAETLHRGIPVWKGKRILTRFSFRIKVGWLRAATEEPNAVANYVFSNPEVIAALTKARMVQAVNNEPPAANARKRTPRKTTR